MSLSSCKNVSYSENCFRMNSLLIILGISISILSCNAAILDYSNITPWKIAYAVYPVYNTEPWVDVWRNQRSPESWVEVWKNQRLWDVFNNAINLRFIADKKNSNNLNKKTTDLGSDSHKNSMQLEKSSNNNTSKSKLSSNNPWPTNDKDWPKNVKKDRASL